MAAQFSAVFTQSLLSLIGRSTGYANSTAKLLKQCYLSSTVTPPSLAGTPAIQSNLLNSGNGCTITWNTPANGVMVGTGDTPNATASGTISFADFPNSGISAAIARMPVGVSGSGKEIIGASLATTVSTPIPLLTITVAVPQNFNTTSLNAALRNMICNALRGGSNGTIEAADYGKLLYGETSEASTITLYGGSIPATADEAASATVLGTYTVPNATEAFAAPSGTSMSLASTIAVPITGSGTITHFRVQKSSVTHGTMVLQGTAGTSGTDAIVSTTTATGSGTIDLTALGLSMSI